MAIKAQKAITAENQFSEKFFLSGSGSSFPGRSALALAPTCPGKLRGVQEWSKVASAKEIGKY